MKEIVVKTGNGNEQIKFNLPTKLTEIDKDWINHVTSCIDIAPHYSLIAIAIKDTLASLINSTKQKSNTSSTGVVPLFIKAGEHDSSFISTLECLDKLIISGSDISIGHHVTIPNNTLSPGKVLYYCTKDNNVYKQALLDTTNIYLLEFKLVPNSAIHGAIFDTELDTKDLYFSVENK